MIIFIIMSPYPGLTRQYSITSLLTNGFYKVYDVFYDNYTLGSDFDRIKDQCSIYSILCAGCGSVDSDILDLVACANCYSVLTPTEQNKPVLVGEAYWYMTSPLSFGFSPNSTIYQNSADTFNSSDQFRLSWHFGQSAGGWRLGNLIDLNSNRNYKKYIFIRN
ncbi:unnamed protein product [Brachionus calyciflorus]|uniref:Uncharacterized protein n=1 Tax=Brachionus calyciflorus TaxID=104777 RepID=A0A814NM22_9BILA|nr:unnamed protein product [Brachionus calyciflorus]